MNTRSFPNRRSVLRVEELNARSLPAVLNPAAVIGDTALVSSAGDEPADDTTFACDVVDTTSDAPADGSKDLVMIDEGGLVPNTLFRPIFWSGSSGDVGTEANPDDQAPTDGDVTAIDVDGVVDPTGDVVDFTATMLFRSMSFRGSPADGETDPATDGLVETDENGDPIQPVVCDFGPISDPAGADGSIQVDDGSAVPGDETGDPGSDTKPDIFFRPINFSGLPADGETDPATDVTVETDANGDPLEPIVCDFGMFSGADGSEIEITSVDESGLAGEGDGDWGRGTNPKYYFRTLTGAGISEDGAGNENVDGITETKDSTGLADDSSLVSVDAGVPVPGDESDIPTVQTFGGPGDDLNPTDGELDFLAYSSMPPAESGPVLQNFFVPLKSESISEPVPAGTPIDGSAWTFFATKRDEVVTAPASASQATPVTVTVPATQKPADATTATSRDQSQSISLDSSAVKKLLGDLSIEQQ